MSRNGRMTASSWKAADRPRLLYPPSTRSPAKTSPIAESLLPRAHENTFVASSLEFRVPPIYTTSPTLSILRLLLRLVAFPPAQIFGALRVHDDSRKHQIHSKLASGHEKFAIQQGFIHAFSVRVVFEFDFDHSWVCGRQHKGEQW